MRPVYIYAIPDETYALVRGVGVGGWFRSQRIPALRSNMHGGFWLRQERVSDVVALLDLHSYMVTVSNRSAPAYVPPPLTTEEAA